MSGYAWFTLASGGVLVFLALAGVWYDRTALGRRGDLMRSDRAHDEMVVRYFNDVHDSHSF